MRDLRRASQRSLYKTRWGRRQRKMSALFAHFGRSCAWPSRRYSGPYVSIDVLLTWSTQRFAAIPVENHPRSGGVSGYTTRKLITHAMNMLTGFSTLPLQIGSIVGFILTVFGVAILAFRHDPLSPLRRSRSRLLFPGLDHFDFFWSATICSRNLWRILGSRAYSNHG